MASPRRALRHSDRGEVVAAVATRLIARLVEFQEAGHAPQLALSGDPVSHSVLKAVLSRSPGSRLQPARLGLWWTDDAFLPTQSRERHSQRALSLLGGLHLDPALIHPVPSSDAYADPEAAAQAYAAELGSTRLDICLLELGQLGQVAGIFPGQRPADDPVVGVTGAPDGPADRVSLGLATINDSREVWVLACGHSVAGLVAASFAGAPSLPGARVSGRERTWWFLDQPAASLLPFHSCEL
ncbi:MAG: 6-phosphogluconolactonase [Propionibacteriaceae bacterium]|jgi:6-phosphogluconolactonase|nr:6-phosphogluconolactonase [Propionibacteriaceae bacterium]